MAILTPGLLTLAQPSLFTEYLSVFTAQRSPSGEDAVSVRPKSKFYQNS